MSIACALYKRFDSYYGKFLLECILKNHAIFITFRITTPELLRKSTIYWDDPRILKNVKLLLTAHMAICSLYLVDENLLFGLVVFQ